MDNSNVLTVGLMETLGSLDRTCSRKRLIWRTGGTDTTVWLWLTDLPGWTIPGSRLEKRAKTGVPFSQACPPVCQRTSRVKGLGQCEWKGLCPQLYWHVYDLPENHIKRKGGGAQIKIEGALNGGHIFVSEYERRGLRRHSHACLE